MVFAIGFTNDKDDVWTAESAAINTDIFCLSLQFSVSVAFQRYSFPGVEQSVERQVESAAVRYLGGIFILQTSLWFCQVTNDKDLVFCTVNGGEHEDANTSPPEGTDADIDFSP